LISVGAESGEAERLGPFGEPLSFAATYWIIQPSHDDRALYLFKQAVMNLGGSTARWDTATRQETVVAAPSDPNEFDQPSTDERWLVQCIYGQSLAVRPMSGGEWRSLTSVREPGFPDVTPDGKSVLYPSGKRGLFRVPIAGGQPERVADSPSEFLNGLWVSPDGRQILTVSTDWGKYDLWVLDNFRPSRQAVTPPW
jgi:Tol biopolymer transport system component